MENQSFFDRMNNWAKSSISLKVFSIGILILILLIPSNWIKNLIREREQRRNEAILEVSAKWGNDQTIGGPVLTVPYKSYWKDDKNVSRENISYAHFLPDNLKINGEVIPKTRYRGIYEIALYQSLLEIEGSFYDISFRDWEINPDNILWKDAFIQMGISDMREINENITLDFNDTEYAFNPGIECNDVFGSGVSTRIKVEADSNIQAYNFKLKLNINGSTSLNFLPLGKETLVKLNSQWADPSFFGSFLPDDRQISPDSFHAEWKVLHVNRNYPQKWLDSNVKVQGSSFGVELFLPVDSYQKTMRSAKYNIMFIFLTFLVFFFIEVINKTRIHAIQYLLVGFAITIFYVLLLSISEHLKFNVSYLIASVGVLLLVSMYSKAVFRSMKMSLIMAMILSLLYIFFFSLLQLKDYALLMGSIGLFIILAIVMYLSRDIDWYAIGKKQSGKNDQAI